MPQHAAPKLLVVTTIPPDLRAALAQRYPLSDLADAASAAGCTVAVTTSMRGFDRPLFDRMPDLELILCNGAGLDGIDLAEARGAQGRGLPHAGRTRRGRGGGGDRAHLCDHAAR